MRKHDEGYALPFVLVVMTVLIIIALGVMGYAQRNLEAQKNSIVRMQEKYAAAGPIEQIIAAGESGKNVEFSETDSLFFYIPENEAYLYVASAKTKDSDVWVIAKFLVAATGDTTKNYDKNGSVLTVNGNGELLEYRIVDKTTALAYVGKTGGGE